MEHREKQSPDQMKTTGSAQGCGCGPDDWSGAAPDSLATHQGTDETQAMTEGTETDAQRLMKETSRDVSDAASRIRQGARSTINQVKEQARGRAASLKQSASRLMEATREQGFTALNRQKQFAADQINHVADAIEEAACRLYDDGDDTLGGLVNSAANGVHRVAGYVNERDLTDLLNEARKFARQRPVVVYGGLFLAGLALARFLKATQNTQSSEDQTQHKQDNATLPSPELSTPPEQFSDVAPGVSAEGQFCDPGLATNR